MASEQASRLGRRIKERRLELPAEGRPGQMTQGELANKVSALTDNPKITHTYVSRWERGEHKPVDDTLSAIAQALQTTVGDLMEGPIAERKPRGATPDPFSRVEELTLREVAAQLTQLSATVNDLLAAAAEQGLNGVQSEAPPDTKDSDEGDEPPRAEEQ